MSESKPRLYSYHWQNTRLGWLRDHPLCAECSRRGRTGAAVIVDPLIPTTATYISSVAATASPQPDHGGCLTAKFFYDFSLAFLSVGEYQDTANR
jgi:hypothetical protein